MGLHLPAKTAANFFGLFMSKGYAAFNRRLLLSLTRQIRY